MRFRATGVAVALAALALTVGCNKASNTATTTAGPETNAPAATAPESSRVHNDGLITSTIQSTYFASREVKGRQIDVDTNDGVVTLRGRVDNDAQKQQAGQIARGVDGVSRVDNQLVVGTTGTAENGPANAPERHSPAWITTKIQAQYFVNPELKPWRIDVDTSYGGIVTLNGRVDSEGDRAEAVRIARGTEGVTRVNDNLRVEPAGEKSGVREEAREKAREAKEKVGSAAERIGEKASQAGEKAKEAANRTGNVIEDAWITMKIQSKFFMHEDIKAHKIDVDTKNGVVTLNGTIDTAAGKSAAEAVAKNTDGVTRVVNNLKVEAH